ncbi:MAG TPA: DUF3566 domain-containing protein [Jatrophihabitantaceae bacterium]|jgi:hypothetical protein|nr:DUF3566 domain-containing protein [Jatrophihabitantaceae bacterium]
MTQPPTTGKLATGSPEPAGAIGDDGFGPTRLERSSAAQPDHRADPRADTLSGDAPIGGSAPGANGSATVSANGTIGTPAAGPPVMPVPPQGAVGGAGQPGTSARGVRAARARGPRRARLQLRHVTPWTVFKFACVLSVFLFLVWMIVVMVLFGILSAAGVVGDVNRSVTTINGPGSTGVITGGRVFGYALIIGVVNVVLFIALTTLGSVVYNLCADLVGGIEVTLSERDT